MLLWTALVVLPFTLLSCVKAQNGTEILQQAMKVLPPCALKCTLNSVAKSSCKLSDFVCITQNEKLMGDLEICVKTTCTIREALTAKGFLSKAFKAPIRDETHLVSYTGLIAGGIATAAVVLRIFARMPCCGGTWGMDDYGILATMVPTLPLTALSIVLAREGLGRDMWTISFDNITNILHIYYFDEIFYIAATALTKVSILLFYLRIFPNRDFRRWTYITMAFCVVYMLTIIPGIIVQCIPISLAWDRWDGQHAGKCLNLNALGWTAAAMNIILDLVVICLPLKEMSQLKMSWRRKTGILLMFLGGGFVTVVSMLRLKWLIQFANTENVSWDYTPVGYWSTLEVHVGIVIACLPALRALQHRLFPSSKTPASYYGNPSGGYGYGTGTKGGGGSSAFPSITSKFRSRRVSKHMTSASQASMMRTRNDDKEFIQLEEYEFRLGESQAEKEAIGRGLNNTQVERGSMHSDDGTFLDTSSAVHVLPARVYEPRPRLPADAITVRKEYSVNVEYGPAESEGSSPPAERALSAAARRSSSVRRDPHSGM